MPDSTHADPRSSSESSRHKLPKLASDEPLQHELVEYERAAQSVFASEGLTPIFNGQVPIDAQCLQDVDIPDAASDVERSKLERDNRVNEVKRINYTLREGQRACGTRRAPRVHGRRHWRF